MRRPGRHLWYLCLVAGLAGGVGAAAAGPPDHESALRALSRGEVKPLDEILANIEPGADTFVGVVLDRSTGRWIYETKWLTSEGRYRIVTLDAATAKILNEELK